MAGVGEEKDSGATCHNKIATNEILESLNLSSNNSTVWQWYTSSSMDEYGTFDDNYWDWERVLSD